MRILVKSTKDMKRIALENPSYLEENSGVAFIVISRPDEMEEDVFSNLNGKNVIHCVFDDLTDCEFENLSDKSSVRLFSEDEADEIASFVLSNISCEMLFVSCSAGISRSGAIGASLNECINREGEAVTGDAIEFYRINPQIQPNCYVFRKMKEAMLKKLEK